MKIYLEFREGSSCKFWSVEVNGASHVVTYGKVGSAGRSKSSEFASEDEAVADSKKQADKKRKKGYADAAPSATPVKKAPATKKPKKAKPPSPRTLKKFYKAMKQADLAFVQAELVRGIDANTAFDIQESGEPWPALYYATFHNKVAVANLLLDTGADASVTFEQGGPLHVVKDGKLAERLVEGGADPCASHRGLTPLHRARNREVAQVLIDAGADLEAETERGLTPFESTMSLEIRGALLAAGAKGLRETEGVPYAMQEDEVALNAIDAMQSKLGVGADGALWVGSCQGIYCCGGESAIRFRSEDYPATVAIEGAHGSTYIATNQGLLRFRDGTFTRYTPNNSPLHDQHLVAMAVVSDEVWCVGYESESKGKHISAFDGERWRLLMPGVDLPACAIEHIHIDAQGRVVVGGGQDGGVHVRGIGSSEWSHEQIADGIFSPNVYAMSTRADTDLFGTHMGLFRRSTDGFEKIRDGAFSQLEWIGDTLWAATSWDGVFSFHGDFQGDVGALDVQEYDEARAGHSLSNVESMAAVGEELYLLAGQKFLRVRDGVFSNVGA